ncbi:MAG TPA: winged helix-turn-helix domain-containing protein [Bdellovibrionales bacterium]|nr:winged helix-turn-helix domain-containing protein [Bdellovibrionales bacterium]
MTSMTIDRTGMGSATKAPRIPPVMSRGAADRHYQHGIFAYHRGDYSEALEFFEKSAQVASEQNNQTRYVETCTYILRILAEREEFAKIDRIEKHITDLIATSDLSAQLKSRATYVLGICSCYQDTRHDQAMNRFREAIDYAILSEDKEALAAPLYGAATVLYARGRYDEAIKELSRLDILLSCLSLPELESSAHFLRAQIRRNQGRTDEALEAAWAAYETLKHHPHLVIYLHTLCVLGTIYQLKGDMTCARLYLDLANRSVKREQFPRIARLINDALNEVKKPIGESVDLAYDTRTGVLIEKIQGEVRFEGQFILRDLLKVFLEQPGRIFTKFDLAKLVWREEYNSDVHDNKIYVTIKRLRQLLECDGGKAEYILRAKNGYFLNPKAKVQIDEKVVQPMERK